MKTSTLLSLVLAVPFLLAAHDDPSRTGIEEGKGQRPSAEEARKPVPPKGRRSSTGELFTPSYEHPSLGDAWKDPSGLVWGDIARDTEGKVLELSHDEAKAHCSEKGARLPTATEFRRLREYLGWPGRYTAHVLPNLDWNNTYVGEVQPYRFWSSTVFYSVTLFDPIDTSFAYRFDGGSGEVEQHHRDFTANFRCVIREE